MNYGFILITNSILENEKIYLEEKYKQGFKLVKKGCFFYTFEEIAPNQDGVYEIELLSKDIEDYHVDNWSMITKRKIAYKKMKKIYYFTEAANSRFLIDENIRLNYYSHKKSLWWSIFSISLILLALLFILSTMSILLSKFWLYVGLYSITSFIYSIKKYHTYEQGFYALKNKIETQLENPIYYLVQFENLTSEQKIGLTEKLFILGHVRKIKENYYQMYSTLDKEDLFKEIYTVTTIEEKNIKLVTLGDLYFMI